MKHILSGFVLIGMLGIGEVSRASFPEQEVGGINELKSGSVEDLQGKTVRLETESPLPSSIGNRGNSPQSLMVSEAARAAVEFHLRVAQLPKTLPGKRRAAKSE